MLTVLRNVLNPKRLQTLIETRLLDSPIEEEFDRLTRLAARILNAPLSLVSLVDQERQFFKSQYGLPAPLSKLRQTPISHSFCQYVVENSGPFIMNNAKDHPILKNHPAVSQLGVVAYLGIPIQMKNGEILGSSCVIDTKPRFWTESEIKILTDLTSSVINEIELRILIENRNEFRDIMVHDVKNQIGAIVLICDLLTKKFTNSNELKFLKPIENIKLSTSEIQKIVEVFNDLTEIESSQVFEHKVKIQIDELVRKTVQQFENSKKSALLKIKVNLQSKSEVLGEPIFFIKSILNLLEFIHFSNVLENLEIETEFKKNLVQIVIRVPQLLLRPEEAENLFDRNSNAISGLKRGQKLALYLAKQYALAHHGNILVQSHLTLGTEFKIQLPPILENAVQFTLESA